MSVIPEEGNQHAAGAPNFYTYPLPSCPTWLLPQPPKESGLRVYAFERPEQRKKRKERRRRRGRRNDGKGREESHGQRSTVRTKQEETDGGIEDSRYNLGQKTRQKTTTMQIKSWGHAHVRRVLQVMRRYSNGKI